MMKIEEIAKDANFTDGDSIKLALMKMRQVPDHELHFHLVLRDTLQTTSPETRQKITLAQIESDRRATAQTRCLAIATTFLSGAVGLLGVALGAYLTR